MTEGISFEIGSLKDLQEMRKTQRLLGAEKGFGMYLPTETRVIESRSRFIIMLSGIRIVGFGTLRQMQENICAIEKIGVLKDFRRDEAGKKLLRKLENFAYHEFGSTKFVLSPSSLKRKQGKMKPAERVRERWFRAQGYASKNNECRMTKIRRR